MWQIFVIPIFLSASGLLATRITLDDALSRALTHPAVAAANANWEAEKAAVPIMQWPRDPMFGLMYDRNQNFMQQQMGAMTSLSFSQDIEFPAKYYFRGRAQESRASRAKEGLAQEKLTLRRKVITAYFQLYANQHIKNLIEAQRETVRQVARIAEARHSVGAVTQQDEMKAHVEQTAVENERFEILREEEALQAKLAALLGVETAERFNLPVDGLPLPEARLPNDIVDVLPESRKLKQSQLMIEESKLQRKLAWLDYAPDFRVGARTVVGSNRPSDNFIFTIDLSVPLWFFARQNSEVSTANARYREAEYNLEKAKRELKTDAQEVAARVRTLQNLIKVFSTTFIPQAKSTFNASRSAYEAGRSTFMELLDSARMVYSIRAAYYRHIAEYVEQLALLEELVGASLSTLPFGDLS